MVTTYRLSSLAKISVNHDFVAVFHQVHPDPIYLTEKRWEAFLNNMKHTENQQLLSLFIEKKLVILSHTEDEIEIEKSKKMLERKYNQPLILYLMMAQHCNFSCKYCPIPKLSIEYGSNLLTFENAVAGINIWKNHFSEDNYLENCETYVIFYGGEPLLNKTTILQIIEFIKDLESKKSLPKVKLMIPTNGSLLDKKIIEVCKKYNITFVIGIDGFREENDNVRITRDGSQTYDDIINSIKIMIEHEIEVCASITITPFNSEKLIDFSRYLRALGVKKIGFNFLKGKFLLDFVGKDNLEQFAKLSTDIIIENSLNQDTCEEYQIEKKLNAFTQKNWFPFDCTCYGNQLVVQADGYISNCPFLRSDIDHVTRIDENFRIWNSSTVKEWRKRLPLFSDRSLSFDEISLYGGGCAWHSHELTGDLLSSDYNSILFTKEVFHAIIWSKFTGKPTIS